MTSSAPPGPPPTVRILLACRAGYFASTRPMARLSQMLSPAGAAGTPRRRALAAGFLVGDLLLARWFAGPGKYDQRYRLRLALDVVDAVVWSALAPDTEFATLIPMVQAAPLAAELGFTQRARGVALGMAAPAAALAVRRIRRQRLRPDQIVWPLVSAVPGVVVTAVDRWFEARVAAAGEEIAARVADARRAARAEFSLVSHAVVDDLRHAAFVVERTTGRPTGWRDHARLKDREIAWAAADDRRFLRTVLDDWAGRRAFPDLHARPVLTCSTDDGLYVLDAEQARALEAILDRVRPVGDVPVTVLRRSRWGRASTEAVLRIGRDVEVLPGPRPLRARRSDGTVAAFDGTIVTQALTAIFMLMPMVDDNGGAHWSACVPTAVVTGLHGLWAGRTTASDRKGSRTVSLGVASVATVVHSALVSRSMRYPHDPDGLVRLPFRFGLFGFHMLIGTHARRVSGGTLAGLAGVSLLSTLITWMTSPRPVQLPVLVADVLGSLPGFGLSNAIRAAADELQATIALDTDAVRRGIEAERADLTRLLHEEVNRLEDVVANAEVDEETSRAVGTLLADLRAALDALPAAAGHSAVSEPRSGWRAPSGRRARSSSVRRSSKRR